MNLMKNVKLYQNHLIYINFIIGLPFNLHLIFLHIILLHSYHNTPYLIQINPQTLISMHNHLPYEITLVLSFLMHLTHINPIHHPFSHSLNDIYYPTTITYNH